LSLVIVFLPEAFMRTFTLMGALLLLLGGCTSKPQQAPPPPVKKELLTGKWKSDSEAKVLAGYEFTTDGKFKLIVKGMKQQVPGSYRWSDDRVLELSYQDTPADVKQEFKDVIKAFKDDVKARVKAKKISDRAEGGLLNSAPDELPPKETYQVAIAEKPTLLILTSTEKGDKQTFEKLD
jgi:hypothetical protein